MRNVFDQYSQHENRLTHALAVSLSEDRRLLGLFLKWIGLRPPSAAVHLSIVEQRLPGEFEQRETESVDRGLPDIVIYDDDGWCVFVESKVESGLTADQLTRHARTLRRRGFHTVHQVALIKDAPDSPEPNMPGTTMLTWASVYEWIGAISRRSSWGDHLRDYLRIAEVRMSEEGKLKDGTLTKFDGFKFSDRNPYTYGEARRLLRLVRAELLKDKRLKALGVDTTAPGRSAIKGKAATSVWDFFQLRGRPLRSSHTGYPHLTFAINRDYLEISVTVPHGVDRSVRRRFGQLGADGLRQLHAQIVRGVRKMKVPEARPLAWIMQRHYLTQSSAPSTDASMMFRLETSLPGGKGRIKHQPDWSNLLAALPTTKRSNIQFQYRIEVPWGAKGIDSPEAIDVILNGWSALTPVLDALTRSK
jgi:hypothetical protein